MPSGKPRDVRRKTFLLSQGLVDRAQEALHTETETKAVIQALEYVSFEKEHLAALKKTAGKGKSHFDLILYDDWGNGKKP